MINTGELYLTRLNYCHSRMYKTSLYIFYKNGPIPASFVYFHYFLDTISIIQIEKSIDGVLGIRTQGRRMVGADETTELWQPPRLYYI